MVRGPVRGLRRHVGCRRWSAAPGRHRAGRGGARERLRREREGEPGRAAAARMNSKVRAGLFILGAGVFAYLVAQIGAGRLAHDAAQTSWLIVPIVSLYALVYACSARAWQLTMKSDPSTPSFWRTYAILVAAGAINFLTPVVNLGGEPYRIAALTPWLGKRRAAGSVILHRMLHSLGYVLVWFTAIVLAFALLPRETPNGVRVILGVAGMLLLGVIALFMSAHRSGVLERVLNWMSRI